MRAWQLELPVELVAKPLAFLACRLAPFRDMAETWAMSPKKTFHGGDDQSGSIHRPVLLLDAVISRY